MARNSFLNNCLLAKVKHPHYSSLKLEIPTSLQRSLQIPKVGGNFLPKQRIVRDFKKNSNSWSKCLYMFPKLSWKQLLIDVIVLVLIRAQAAQPFSIISLPCMWSCTGHFKAQEKEWPPSPPLNASFQNHARWRVLALKWASGRAHDNSGRGDFKSRVQISAYTTYNLRFKILAFKNPPSTS